MRTIKIRIMGMIRYLRPDRNPLRRPVDRTHGVLVIACLTAMMTAGPLVATMVAGAAYHAGLRTERHQNSTRHPVAATVLSVPPGYYRFSTDQKTAVQWRDATGAPRSGTVPLRGGGEPGVHRTIWLDAAGRTISPPTTQVHTVIGAIATSATSVGALCLLLFMAYLVLEHRLDQRRSASWEKEWAVVSPRWTGRPRRRD